MPEYERLSNDFPSFLKYYSLVGQRSEVKDRSKFSETIKAEKHYLQNYFGN